MAPRDRSELYILSAAFFCAVVARLEPLFRFGRFGFGYDSGFYRRYVIEPFASFPNTPVPGLDHTVFLPRMILDAARFLLRQPDIALYGTYIAASLIGCCAVWRFARHYVSSASASYAVGLFALSGVQFVSYGGFFFKEAIALPLFLFAILCYEREQYEVATMLGILIVLTQQTSAVLLLAIAGAGFLLRSLGTRTISIPYIFSGTVVLASYLFLHPHVAQKLATPPVGVLFSQETYLLYSVPLIAFAVLGCMRFFPLARKNPLLMAALGVPLMFAIFHLPFYNRVYVFLDLFLVVPAALGIESASQLAALRLRLSARLLAPVLLLLSFTPLFFVMRDQAPAIEPGMQQLLPALSALPEGSAVITSPRLLPWVQGWSLAHVYAPGNLKEPHPLSEWSVYFAHRDSGFERGFLASFPEPTFVIASPREIEYRPACATEVRPYLYSLASCR
jgi:hypothetical protein